MRTEIMAKKQQPSAPKQLTEPLEYPCSEIEVLCEALNAANDAMWSYFKSRSINFAGNLFDIADHKQRKELMAAAHKYDTDFLHNIILLMAQETSARI
jgi:hypothetical protein